MWKIRGREDLYGCQWGCSTQPSGHSNKYPLLAGNDEIFFIPEDFVIRDSASRLRIVCCTNHGAILFVWRPWFCPGLWRPLWRRFLETREAPGDEWRFIRPGLSCRLPVAASRQNWHRWRQYKTLAVVIVEPQPDGGSVGSHVIFVHVFITGVLTRCRACMYWVP